MQKLKKFKSWLSLQGLNKKSQKQYYRIIKKFFKSYNNINQKSINKYFLMLKEKQLKNTTLNLYKNGIKKYLEFNNMQNIKLPKFKNKKRMPEYVTEKYFLEKIIPIITKHSHKPLKIKALLYLLFYSGIRLEECANLKRKDVDLKNKRLKITGKGDKERYVIFNEKTKKVLQNYFLTEPEKYNVLNLKYGNIRRIFKTFKPYFKKDDVNLHPHLLRHSFATHMLKLGMNLKELKKLLGHSSISTTEKYAHANIDDIQEKFDKLERSDKR